MRKKVFIIFTSYVFIVLLITLIQSCGLLEYDASICDITFTGINSSNEEPDTFVDEVGFVIMSDSYEICYMPNLKLIKTCNATTKCAQWQNSLVVSSFELSFSRPFTLQGDTIQADSNIFDISRILSGTEIEVNADCKFVTGIIVFTKELLSEISFKQGEYIVTFYCETTDDKQFTKTRKVIFNE